MTMLLSLLLEASIKSSMVLLFTYGVTALLRRQSAALRHAFWTAGLICALAAPVLSLILPAWHLNLEQNRRIETQRPVAIQTTEHTNPTANPTLSETTHPSARYVLQPSSAILLLWLCGLAAVAMKLSVEFSKLAWLAFGATPVRQESLTSLVREVSIRIQLKRLARLLCNPNASVLGTWGMLRPRIILPGEAVTWTSERMTVVLGHELAHVKRNDWLVQIVAEAARTVFWFNPLFWIACNRLRRESEYACDDTAMSLGVDGPSYASHVLELARTLKHCSPTGAAALAMANPSNLERRLVAMLNPSLNRRAASKSTFVLIILAALALTFPIAAMHPQQTQPAKPAAAEMVNLPGGFQVSKDSLTSPAEIVARGQVSQRRPNSDVAMTISASTTSLSTAAASPQPPSGAISGTVSDPSGALVPGARVTVVNQSTGVSAEALSNDSGAFSISSLTPGNYSMNVYTDWSGTSNPTVIPVQAGNNTQVAAKPQVRWTTVIEVRVSSIPGSCLQLLGTTKADGTTYTRADCVELNAAERNVPPHFAPPPMPDEIVILGTFPLALVPSQIPAANGQRLRIGGVFQPGNLIYHPSPIYPPEARRIGLGGQVVFSATIDAAGVPQTLTVIDSSNLLFNQPSFDAIQTWKYKPTFLNNEPVAVPTTITVNFSIGR